MAHSPQSKILEFLIAILAGLEHLQDLRRSAHPLDQDQAGAKSWQQSGWTDYSGVSRTLSGLTQAEAEQIVGVVEQSTRPILAEEVMCTLQSTGRLTYDGDLTARPVSNTSSTIPVQPTGTWAMAYSWVIKQQWSVCTAPCTVASDFR